MASNLNSNRNLDDVPLIRGMVVEDPPTDGDRSPNMNSNSSTSESSSARNGTSSSSTSNRNVNGHPTDNTNSDAPNHSDMVDSETMTDLGAANTDAEFWAEVDSNAPNVEEKPTTYNEIVPPHTTGGVDVVPRVAGNRTNGRDLSERSRLVEDFGPVHETPTINLHPYDDLNPPTTSAHAHGNDGFDEHTRDVILHPPGHHHHHKKKHQLDLNTFSSKQSLAHGVMDAALLAANANQLRYLIESESTKPFYYFSFVLLITSIITQIALGIGLILKERYRMTINQEARNADKANGWIVLTTFFLTFINVFITAFSLDDEPYYHEVEKTLKH